MSVITGIDIGLAHPLQERHDVDAEVGRDLLQRDTGITVPGDTDDVVSVVAG